MAMTLCNGTVIPRFHTNDVVQFGEKHKWAGCFGIIGDVQNCGDDVRYMIGVPIPGETTASAYIFSMERNHEFYYIGHAELSTVEDEDERD